MRPLSRAFAGILITAALSMPSTADAWTADEPWRTIETAHYRIHYPASAEAWALDLAGRADAMRERVAAVVGWQPDRPTEMVVMDPWGRANGFAIPFARQPLMGVFTTAPGAESGIGNYRLWAEDLVVHEDAHLLHLGRPSRNPLEKVVYEGLLGIPAIAVKSPGWVIEGYATLVEGILTGAGRPNSDGRATFLRTLARDGQLPTYDELDGSARWRGRGMRYLVGSAYLEWLAAAHGDEALPQLWARMTARERRDFDEAFTGVFGAAPAVLYGRFVAELTAGALAAERSEGTTLWRDLSGEVGAPAVSPSGEKVALVVSPEEGPRQLQVLAVAVDEAAQEEAAEARAELLADDPEDVPAVDRGPPPHEELAVRKHGGRSPVDPRWIDEDTLLFSSWRPDARGNGVPDLFTWDTETGRERRLTRGANLRQAEPCGDFAVAVHRAHGLSGLVRVDLATGAVSPLTTPDPTVVDGGPRLSADCQTLAFLRNDGAWRVVVAQVDDVAGTATTLPLPEGGQPLSLDLRPDGSGVVVGVGVGGWFDLWEQPLGADRAADGPWLRHTAGPGGVFSPEASPDGSVFYLAHDARGFDLHRVAADAPAPVLRAVTDDRYTRGVVRPPPVVDAPPLAATPGFTPRPAPYGLGRQRLRLTTSGELAGGGTLVDRWSVGLTMGDLVGRSELIALAGIAGSDAGLGFAGARAAWTLRRWRIHPVAEAWVLPTTATGGIPAGSAPGALAPGGGLSLRHHRVFGTGALSVAAGGWGGGAGEGGGTTAAGVGWLDWQQQLWMGPVALFSELGGEGRLAAEATAGRASGRLALGQRDWQLGGRWDRARAAAGTVAVGRLAPSIQPRMVTAGGVWWPEVGLVGTTTGATRARAEARFAAQALGLWVERAQLDQPDCAGACVDWLPVADRAWTLAGLDLDATVAAQPIARVATVNLKAGAACMVAAPGTELDWRGCSDSAAWTGWLGVRVVPGAPPAYP